MPLASITIILTMLVYCEFAVANLLLESPCGPNKAQRQNLLGNAKTGTSRIECGLLCETNDACNSFTYNRRSGLCQLSTDAEKNCNLLTDETDSMYFTAVSNATPTVSPSDEMLPSSCIYCIRNNGQIDQELIFDIAPFSPIMFKSNLESLDSCYCPYSQLNSFRNSNVFSCFLRFCTLSAALLLSGSSFQIVWRNRH